MKKCPFCGEQVQDEAVKCRYCKEWLSNPGENMQQSGNIPDQDKQRVSTTGDKAQKQDSLGAIPAETRRNRTMNGSVLDSSNLTKWLKIFLYASIVINVIAVFSGILQYQLLSDFKQGVYTSVPLATAAGEVNDNRQQLIAWISVLIFLITVFLFLTWIHRANYNARQLGAKNMKFTPGWAIGWYFIPIAALFKPYQAMKEIWKASKNPDDWQDQSVSSILPWWWFFVIIDVVFARILFKAAMRAIELDDLISVSILSNVSDIISIPLIMLTIVLVSRIYEMQIAQRYMPAQQRDNDQPQKMSSPSAVKDSETLFSRHNRGLLALIIGIPLIGIIAAIAIPGYLGMQERARKAQNGQTPPIPVSAPAETGQKDPWAVVSTTPTPVQGNKLGLIDDLGILKDRWTFVASGNDLIKQNFFYDKTSVHYPHGNKDSIRVWTKVENITPIATNNPPVNIKYTTVLVEIDCQKRTGTWVEENYIGDDGLIFRTDHKNKTQDISPDMFWQHLYKALCQ